MYTISKKKKIDIISTSDKYGNKNNFFEKDFFYVGVSPIPQLIYTNLAQNYPIYVGPQALIRVFVQNQNFR